MRRSKDILSPYTSGEEANLSREFSPALVEVLKVLTPVWGNKIVLPALDQESTGIEREVIDESSLLLRLRQLGDRGLRQAMQFLSGGE